MKNAHFFHATRLCPPPCTHGIFTGQWHRPHQATGKTRRRGRYAGDCRYRPEQHVFHGEVLPCRDGTAGVKPIIGVDSGSPIPPAKASPRDWSCCAGTMTDFSSLTRLVSRTYTRASSVACRCSRTWLLTAARGDSSRCPAASQAISEGPAGNRQELAAQSTRDWCRLFPDSFYLELQRTGRHGEEAYLHRRSKLAAPRTCRWSPPTTCIS